MAALLSACADEPRGAAEPGVITDWNEAAVATIATDAGKANAEAFIWFAFTQAAVYNAVVGITRRYQLYQWDVEGPQSASPQAAAAAAAHGVLANYFPASKTTRLDQALAASLAGIPDGSSKQQGIQYGERAAARIIELRKDDGRSAPLSFDVPLAAGVWRPTPPANAPFFAPWLSKLRPLTLSSPGQFRPDAPPALTSATYTTEFNEVKTLGSKTGSQRTPAQTETALLFSDIAIGPLQASLRDLATRRRMNISDSARLFAAVDMSLADAIIVSWDSKLQFGLWRPITAIRMAADDGNPDTQAAATWDSLIPSPPYPDYASAFTTVVGALSRSLTRVLGSSDIDLNITSAAAGTPGAPLTRHYGSPADLNRDVVDARVWCGIHFRTADVVGNAMGTEVANWALDHYLQPAK
jgi:hypothetical protein